MSSRKIVAPVLVSWLAVLCTLVLAPSAFAWGQVLVPASAWNGVDVHSNFPNLSNWKKYPTEYGYKWQCVELAQRFYSHQKWVPVKKWGVSYAYQMYDRASKYGLATVANGSIKAIDWGDLVIWKKSLGATKSSDGTGHVAVVSSVKGSKITIVEQNWSKDGKRPLKLSNGTLSDSTGKIRGIIKGHGTGTIPGLVGYWSFDDASNLGRDDSGANNHGEAAPGYVSYSASGRIGGAASFVAGSNAGITVPDSPSLELSSGITIAAWVKMDSGVYRGATVLSKSDSQVSDDEWVFWASKANLGSGDMGAGFSSANDDSGIVVPSGSWRHVVMTYSGGPSGVISFYVDGLRVASFSSSADGMAISSSPVHIGSSPGGGQEEFSGLMDEVRLYRRALSASEVATLFRAQ
jgi:surface antigen